MLFLEVLLFWRMTLFPVLFHFVYNLGISEFVADSLKTIEESKYRTINVGYNTNLH